MQSVSGTMDAGPMPAAVRASSQPRNSSRRTAATCVQPASSVAPMAKWNCSTSPASDSSIAYGTTCAIFAPAFTGSSGRASVTLGAGCDGNDLTFPGDGRGIGEVAGRNRPEATAIAADDHPADRV